MTSPDIRADQFKTHAWQVPSLPVQIFSGNWWENNEGFSDVASNENNTRIPTEFIRKQYADLDVALGNSYNTYVRNSSARTFSTLEAKDEGLQRH